MKKASLALFACLVATAAVAQHQHRLIIPEDPHQAALTVRDDRAGTLVVRLGPVDLPANSDHSVVAQPRGLPLVVPVDGWFTAYHPRLVDENGNLLPSRLLHHVAFWNTARSDFLCPNKMEHIFGAGGEMNDWPSLPGVGYRVHRGDRILVTSMFHNPTETAHPLTYLEMRIEYTPAAGAATLASVYPAWFDVKQCGESSYDLKPGSNVTSGEFTLNFSGRLLGVGGHLHNYGQQLRLSVGSDAATTVAMLEAKSDAQGRIVSIPVISFAEAGGYPLQKGERLRVTATYNNLTGEPLHEGAMGIVVGYFLPQDDGQMAALARK